MSAPTAVSWLKLPIIGMPGTECGRTLLKDSTTVVQEDFRAEFGACEESARWMLGHLFLCQEHASKVAAEFGDDIAEIEAAWRDGYL